MMRLMLGALMASVLLAAQPAFAYDPCMGFRGYRVDAEALAIQRQNCASAVSALIPPQ